MCKGRWFITLRYECDKGGIESTNDPTFKSGMFVDLQNIQPQQVKKVKVELHRPPIKPGDFISFKTLKYIFNFFERDCWQKKVLVLFLNKGRKEANEFELGLNSGCTIAREEVRELLYSQRF